LVEGLLSIKMQTEKIRQADEMSIRETAFDRLWELAGFKAAPQGFDEIDMRTCGDIVYERAMRLSKKINHDLLMPIARWIDDPNWIKKYQLIEDQIPNWATYKKHQRQRIKRLKALARERLRNYWHEIRGRQKYRKEISKLYFRIPSRANSRVEIDEGFISPIVSPFSPPEQKRSETIQQFLQARQMSLSDLLPWKLMISSDLTKEKSLNDLKIYCSDKKDKISKLIHLLHMETEGNIKITQNEPFGEIKIEPLDIACNQNIKIKDYHSREYIFAWNELSDNQQARIIVDVINNKILCRAV